MADPVALGSAIAARRRALSLSRGDLAARSGISRSHVGRVEAGLREPGLAALERLAEALQTTPSALLRAAEKEAAR